MVNYQRVHCLTDLSSVFISCLLCSSRTDFGPASINSLCALLPLLMVVAQSILSVRLVTSINVCCAKVA